MTDVDTLIDVASEFSAYPAGRDDRDGPYNGTRFRDDVLLPRLRDTIAAGGTLVVQLDGVRSFGSSFLEEAFGGLVRSGLSPKDINEHLELRLDGPGRDRYISAIKLHIERARPVA